MFKRIKRKIDEYIDDRIYNEIMAYDKAKKMSCQLEDMMDRFVDEVKKAKKKKSTKKKK